jgi:hypothetical protein
MTDEFRANQLLLLVPILLGSSIVVAFGICYFLFSDDRQRLYKSTVASVAITQLAGWLPFSFFMMYTTQRALLSVGPATIRTLWFSMFIFPQTVAILLLAVAILIRHARGPEKSYKAEALVALFVAIAGAAWTTFWVAALSVAH